MKRTPLFQAATAALLLSLGCSPDDPALHCADALVRSGSEQTPGPWGDAYATLAAAYAGTEVMAASLLSTEAQTDTAFAWPVYGEQWTLTIPSPSQAPANLDLDLRHLSDVLLRLHHRAGTIAPAGQGTFTSSCG